jgi:hypothetical protein
VPNQFVPDDNLFAVTFPTLPGTAGKSALLLGPGDEGQSVVVYDGGEKYTLTWIDGNAGDPQSRVDNPSCSHLFDAPGTTPQQPVTIAQRAGVQCDWVTSSKQHEIGQYLVVADRLYAFTAVGPAGQPNARLDPFGSTLELR